MFISCHLFRHLLCSTHSQDEGVYDMHRGVVRQVRNVIGKNIVNQMSTYMYTLSPCMECGIS